MNKFLFEENPVQKKRYIDGFTDSNLDKTVDNVVKLLLQQELTISTAESCTGGMVSQLITSVSGASSVFELGICSYSDRIKNRFLFVPENDLKKYTAVSPQVCAHMADGIRKQSDSDISVSVTGLAGPGGGSAEKPVGTVYIGCSYKDKTEIQRLHLEDINDRDKIRQLTAYAVFLKLYDVLNDFDK